jgi:hypothetical protein
MLYLSKLIALHNLNGYNNTPSHDTVRWGVRCNGANSKCPRDVWPREYGEHMMSNATIVDIPLYSNGKRQYSVDSLAEAE